MNTKKKILIAVAAAVVAGGAIGAYVVLKPVKVPDIKKEPEKALEFLASKNFQKLKPEEQARYLNDFRQNRPEGESPRVTFAKLAPEQQKVLQENMRTVMEQRMRERVNAFFKLSKEEQLAEIDRRIAEGDRRRNNMDQQRPPRNNNNPPAVNNGNNNSGNNTNVNRRNPPNAQQRREFYESTDPSIRAKMRQMREMERLRRQGKL